MTRTIVPKKRSKPTTLLIDADILLYRFGHASEETYEWSNGVVSISADLDEAKNSADSYVDWLLDHLEAEEYVMVFSDARNFRKHLYPAYKENRAKARKPMVLGPLKEYLMDAHPSKSKKWLEADDVLGIMATDKRVLKGKRKVVVSIDKDLEQIPGFLFDANNEEYPKGRAINTDEADYHHLYQTLCGDSVDNYPGLRGVGPKKAEKILQEDSSWQSIVKAFESKGFTEEDALLQARLAKILRTEDYDYKRNKPKLWTPQP